MASINTLPVELLEYILSFISPYEDLRNCRQVCHRWYMCCAVVVRKRKLKFYSAILNGKLEWSSVENQSHLVTITKRYSHSAAIYDTSMYVFGGCTATNTTFNDLWKFHIGSHKWTRLLTTGTYPSPKTYASMVNWNHHLILFGGWTHPSASPIHQQLVLYNELHIYDILENRWTSLSCPGSPPPIAGHSASIHGDVMVVIGGLQKLNSVVSSSIDIYCYNVISEMWYRPLISETTPLPRYGHSHIKIDERHILIIAGSGGLNELHHDMWLLKLPDDLMDFNAVWEWKQITVNGNNNAPCHLWYTPACKVGNYIVMFSENPNLENKGSGGSMSQLLVPGSVRRQNCNVWVPPAPNPPGAARDNQRRIIEQPNEIPEVNVNGRRGVFRMGANGPDFDSSSDESESGNRMLPSNRGRVRPSIRPNASSDRDRRLQLLSKMEEKLKSLSEAERKNANKPSLSKVKYKNSLQTTLYPHLLDIANIISTETVEWKPVNNENESFGISPPSCHLSSLLLGRGHLIMFGGIQNDAMGMNEDIVSNTVTFISAPSSYL